MTGTVADEREQCAAAHRLIGPTSSVSFRATKEGTSPNAYVPTRFVRIESGQIFPDALNAPLTRSDRAFDSE